MRADDGEKDPDLLTALKKYVEDACGGIKEVDNVLKRNGSSLEALLYEIPGTSDGNVSWRDLIGRRDVIAHQLLTVDDDRVYHEAERERDFGFPVAVHALQELLSRVHFAPIRTDFGSGRGACPLLRTEALNKLSPSAHGERPQIGTSIVFVFEDVPQIDGFLCLRMGRTEKNKLTLATPRRIYFSLTGVQSLENVRDDKGFMDEALSAAVRTEQGVFVGPKRVGGDSGESVR